MKQRHYKPTKGGHLCQRRHYEPTEGGHLCQLIYAESASKLRTQTERGKAQSGNQDQNKRKTRATPTSGVPFCVPFLIANVIVFLCVTM